MPFPSRDLTHAGKTQSISHWARETGIPAATIRSRLFKFGWSVERALATPPDRRFRRGGRKRKDAPRACPELKRHKDGRAYCEWFQHGRKHFRSFGPWGSAGARAAYRRFGSEWAGSAGRVGAGEEEGCTVDRLVVRWIAHCEATYRKRGRETSEVHCNRAAMLPVVERYGEEPARDFTPPKLRAVREEMVAKGWVRDTVNAQVGRVVRAFAWAATEMMVPASVHAALALVEPLVAGRRADVGEGEGVEPVPAEHVAAVLAGGHLHRNAERRAALAAMIRVQLLTGMRPGEVCGLRADQIDRRHKTWRYKPVEFNKMLHRDVGRPILFGPDARAILEPFLERAGTSGVVFALPPARKGAGPSEMTPRRYRDYVQAACDAAGVPRWAPNQLRHNRATELLDRFEDDAAVAQLLGHSPEVLRQVYAKNPGEGVARRIAEATG